MILQQVSSQLPFPLPTFPSSYPSFSSPLSLPHPPNSPLPPKPSSCSSLSSSPPFHSSFIILLPFHLSIYRHHFFLVTFAFPFPPARLISPHLTSSHLTSPHLTSPHLASPCLTSPQCPEAPVLTAYIDTDLQNSYFLLTSQGFPDCCLRFCRCNQWRQVFVLRVIWGFVFTFTTALHLPYARHFSRHARSQFSLIFFL